MKSYSRSNVSFSISGRLYCGHKQSVQYYCTKAQGSNTMASQQMSSYQLIRHAYWHNIANNLISMRILVQLRHQIAILCLSSCCYNEHSESPSQDTGQYGGADFSSPQPDTDQLTLRDDRHRASVSHGVPVCSPAFAFTRLSLVLTLPIHWGIARLSWPQWLVTQYGLPAHRIIWILNKASAAQICWSRPMRYH